MATYTVEQLGAALGYRYTTMRRRIAVLTKSGAFKKHTVGRLYVDKDLQNLRTLLGHETSDGKQ